MKSTIEEQIGDKLIGQSDFLKVASYLRTYEAGLSPEDQPAGCFLLTGPSGCGKTRSVEVIAELLHGSSRHILRIDCGEFQMDHEVAKLIGAPPGYLGHRETQPMISQARINSVASERSSLSILLFDEIDKAAPSLMRLLLGIMDRGKLRLGDNNMVSLERCIIFMTSNFGTSTLSMTKVKTGEKIEKYLSPEFFNRFDEVISFKVLSNEDIRQIITIEIDKLRKHIDNRLGKECFRIQMEDNFFDWAIENYKNSEYGFRPIKRFIRKKLVHNIADLYLKDEIEPDDLISVGWNKKSNKIVMTIN